MISLQKGQGVELKRRRQTFHATSTGDYVSTSSSQIRIEMNIDKECIDFENTYLMFDISATQTGSNGQKIVAPAWEASAWMRDIRVYDRAGREIGEQVRQYNAYCKKQFELLGNDGANDSYLSVLEGAGTSTNEYARQSASDDGPLAAKEYAHKLQTHIFDLKSYFPAHLIGGLIVEIDMESTGNVYYLDSDEATDNTIDSYTVSNVRFVTDLVLLKADAEAQLRSQVASGGLEINYESPMNMSQAVQANATSQRFDLGVANGHVKKIEAFQVLDTVRDGVNEAYFASFAQNGLSSYRFRLGSEYLTEKDVQVSTTRQAEYLVEFLKAQNLDSSDIKHFYGDSGLTLSSWFCLGQKVEISKDASVLSGRRDMQSNTLYLELTFASAPNAATLYTQVLLDKTLVIKPNREFVNMS